MNYKITLSYDGTNFFGWGTQPKVRTIQEVVENILSTIFNEKINIFASGRTDKYVHALNQVISFKTDKSIEYKELLTSLNKMSPIDILFKEVKIVNDKFHARFSAKYKTYIYLISSIDEIFKRNYQFFYEHKINIIKIKKAMKLFIGNHDFKSFSTSVLDNSIRTISKFNIKKRKHMYVFSITGNGFLRNMVRMILGSLLDINENKKNINDITKLLSNPKKGSSIAKVPGCGLYLKEVKY